MYLLLGGATTRSCPACPQRHLPHLLPHHRLHLPATKQQQHCLPACERRVAGERSNEHRHTRGATARAPIPLYAAFYLFTTTLPTPVLACRQVFWWCVLCWHIPSVPLPRWDLYPPFYLPYLPLLRTNAANTALFTIPILKDSAPNDVATFGA